MKDNIINYFKLHTPNIIWSIVILVVGLILVKFFMSILKKIFKKSKLDPICHKFILSFIKVTLYIIVGISALTELGVPPTSLITVLGAAGLAIGLAVQDSLANLAGGFILLFTKPFKVGDYIQIADITGTVKHINVLQTKLDTIDNKAIFIPNGQVSTAKIINYSAEPTRRLDLVFSIGYQADFQFVKQLLTDIVEKNPLTLKDPPPIIRMTEHGASSIKIAVKVWVLTENYMDLNFDLLEEVKLAFDKNKITIPFTQMDVNIISKEK
ncbi:mechanosensitive ion channel [Paludicola sp. MB14-C6]|uniref:mechanosensitive ion channel family protein n=1 Tax=Paludihabitans sp. MB14-C6 TaxID=3070656 RepID=UPI0027DB4DFA|nr:mechanosensitive ion channel domain-containing protein [Paludicola sp. MB14-C6]WMJ23601.1 mechanosensitive ion channel [Paludicola sp. MB14-C6]